MGNRASVGATGRGRTVLPTCYRNSTGCCVQRRGRLSSFGCRAIAQSWSQWAAPVSGVTPRKSFLCGPAGDREAREIPANVSIRVLTEPADFRLFRLHTAWAPVDMRAADGMTVREWQESLATRWIDVRKTTDIVASVNGGQIGWVRFGQVGSNAVIARCAAAPEQPEAIEALIESVIQSSGRSRTIMFLTPTHDAATARALTSRGFRSEATYKSFACQMGQRVFEGALAPIAS